MNSKRKSVVFLVVVVLLMLAVVQIASAGPEACDTRVPILQRHAGRFAPPFECSRVERGKPPRSSRRCPT